MSTPEIVQYLALGFFCVMFPFLTGLAIGQLWSILK